MTHEHQRKAALNEIFVYSHKGMKTYEQIFADLKESLSVFDELPENFTLVDTGKIHPESGENLLLASWKMPEIGAESVKESVIFAANAVGACPVERRFSHYEEREPQALPIKGATR